MSIRMESRLLSTRPAGEGQVSVTLEAPGIANLVAPGQFVMVGPLGPSLDPFLNRPFSVAGAEGGRLELLVAVVGRGTLALANLPAGSKLPVLGPLGRGFQVPEGTRKLLLVGGGIGVAPLLFLRSAACGEARARQRPEKGDAERAVPWREQSRTCILLVGARTERRLVPDLAREGIQVDVATDDGSAGHRGFVTDLLAQQLAGLEGEDKHSTLVAVCGPEPMMRVAAALGREHGVRVLVSLENRMACGTGACMGCADMIGGWPQRVCVEGPVFDAREVFA